MYKDFMFFMKKYSKEFDNMTKVSSKLINCNKTNCKKESTQLICYMHTKKNYHKKDL